MAEASGQDLLDIANTSWKEKKGEYKGFAWSVAVGQAKQQIEKKKGGNKDRRTEAEHNVTVLFNHARDQEASRLDTIAKEAAASPTEGVAASGNGELTAFASEVTELINGVHSGGFGIIDPGMIISLIQAIIQAIAACKKPPVPATT